MIDLIGLLLAILIGAAALLASETLRTRARARQRMRHFTGALGIDDDVAGGSAAARTGGDRGRNDAQGTLLAALTLRYPLSGGARTALIACAVGVLAAAALGSLLVFVGMTPALAVVAALVAAIVVGSSMGSLLEDRQREAWQDRFLLALEDFQRMVRYGIPAMRALQSVTDSAGAPLQSSLQNILLSANFGVPLERAIGQEAHRVRMSELAMLAAIISTQSSTGGNLSEAVGNMTAMLRERLDNRARLRSSTAESRMTLIVLSIVPVLGVGLQASMQPDIVRILFNEGRHLLGIGLALIGSGLGLSWMMIRRAQR